MNNSYNGVFFDHESRAKSVALANLKLSGNEKNEWNYIDNNSPWYVKEWMVWWMIQAWSVNLH